MGCQPRPEPLTEAQQGQAYAVAIEDFFSRTAWQTRGKWEAIFVSPTLANWSYKGRLLRGGTTPEAILTALKQFAPEVKLGDINTARTHGKPTKFHRRDVTLNLPAHVALFTFGRIILDDDGRFHLMIRYYFSDRDTREYEYILTYSDGRWTILNRTERG